MNLKEFSIVGSAIANIADNIVVKADKGGGVASPQMTFMSTFVNLNVRGTVMAGTVGIELLSSNEAGEKDTVVNIPAECDKDGNFDIRYNFDPISLAVYNNAVSFQVNILGLCDNSEFSLVSVSAEEGEESAYDSSNGIDIIKKSQDGRCVVPVMQTDGSIIDADAVPGKVLFIGNSLLLGMHNTYGMCSSAPDKDYSYRVSEYIKSINPECTFTKLHGSGFEHSESVDIFEEWLFNTDNVYTGKPACQSFDAEIDLIFIQLGDNVNTDEKRATFMTTADMFVEFIKRTCPKARIIWIYGWYGTKMVFDKIRDVTGKWHMETVFIGSLRGEENESYSGMKYYNPETGAESVVKDTWITHPGDKGMEKIANAIIDKIGI